MTGGTSEAGLEVWFEKLVMIFGYGMLAHGKLAGD